MASLSCRPIIPRRVLFGEAGRSSPQISPDGHRLAYLAPFDSAPALWVSGLHLEDARPVTERRDRGIIHFFWSKDSRFLLYLWDHAGNEQWQVRAVDVATGTDRGLTDAEGVSAQIVGMSPTHPDEILVAINRRAPETFDIWRIHVATSQQHLSLQNPGRFVDWITDAELEVRAALAARPDGGFDLMVRSQGSPHWRQAIRWEAIDSLTSGPVGFHGDGDRLYVLDSRGTGTSRLIDLDIHSLEMKLVAQHPKVDVSRVMRSPTTRDVQAVSFTSARNEWRVLNDDLRADFKVLEKLEIGDFYIYSRDLADRVWIVAFISDIRPVSFYLYQHASRTARLLFEHCPELRSYRLAPVKPIEFTAKDGLRIQGYLAVPPGETPTGLPIVVKIHSGPWTRDHWDYDPETQWLTNRGYACLRVNFRGSTGYGKDLVNAGNHEWGGRMQDDIADAIEWAVAAGVADRDRICVFGLSYGGYAALMAAATRPNLVRCVVDLMGPTDLCSFIEDLPPQLAAFRHVFEHHVGDPIREREFLRQRSPLHLVDRIRAPVFVAHTENDPRVAKKHSDQLVAALREKGVQCDYLVFEAEGHGLAGAANRERLYASLEQFLARHLGGHCE